MLVTSKYYMIPLDVACSLCRSTQPDIGSFHPGSYSGYRYAADQSYIQVEILVNHQNFLANEMTQSHAGRNSDDFVSRVTLLVLQSTDSFKLPPDS